jgi:RES domain-containing protein
MALVWRLTPPAFARALDGEGSSMVGGRWNSPGVTMVYTSSHLSLCVLEVFLNLPANLRLELPEFEAVHISVPDDAGTTQIGIAEFDTMLSAGDPLAACRTAGDNWIAAATDLVFAAPSVVVPEELNIMINPTHPRMREVAIVSTRPFRFDPRLTAGGR